MCVKIYAILFKMLKNVFKIGYQTAPKFICNDLLSIQCFGKPFMFCWACFRSLPNTISMKLHFMLYQTIKNAKKEKRSSRRPSNQVELSRHSIMDHLFIVV